ncbi:UNVERIFIED_CONTAM: hypothetical protein HDU68_005194 [Siphonaria sp. JEL0065]|nr:hypothetical protein HDU68_005194 [Siphonaria sp. JEL0065]
MDHNNHYMFSQESDGSNSSGIVGLGGGMLTKGTNPLENDEIILHFEPGTWGTLINNLLPMFPQQQQQRIKQDMLLFGRDLVLPLTDISPTPSNLEFCDFLYNLKLAAGYETSTFHFIEYMETPSRTHAEQAVKANIHLSLSKLGGKTRLLKRRLAESVGGDGKMQQRNSGLFGAAGCGGGWGA